MELLQLQYFRTAARLQHFSKAAAFHGVPQSSISRTIARLEAELSCPLFTRTGKHVTLNEYGIVFLDKVTLALDSLSRGVSELESMTQTKRGNIRLAVRETSKLLPDILSAFLAIHPDAGFSLVQHQGSAAVPDDFDLCITALPVEEASLHCQELLTEDIQLAVPANHAFALKPSVDLAQAREERFIGLTAGKSLRRVTDAYCSLHGFTPNIVFESDDAATVRGLIENGLGIAFVPLKSWKTVPSDRIRLLPIADMDCQRTIAVCWFQGQTLSPAADAFRRFIVAWYAML